jgi:hypothetical protein
MLIWACQRKEGDHWIWLDGKGEPCSENQASVTNDGYEAAQAAKHLAEQTGKPHRARKIPRQRGRP